MKKILNRINNTFGYLRLLSLFCLTLSTLYHFCKSDTSFLDKFVASNSPSDKALERKKRKKK